MSCWPALRFFHSHRNKGLNFRLRETLNMVSLFRWAAIKLSQNMIITKSSASSVFSTKRINSVRLQRQPDLQQMTRGKDLNYEPKSCRCFYYSYNWCPTSWAEFWEMLHTSSPPIDMLALVSNSPLYHKSLGSHFPNLSVPTCIWQSGYPKLGCVGVEYDHHSGLKGKELSFRTAACSPSKMWNGNILLGQTCTCR